MTEVKVYYMADRDRVPALTPFLLLDGRRIWQCFTKKRNSNANLYYLLLDSENNSVQYIKLFKDRKRNLLFYIGNTSLPIFSKEEPDIFYIDTITRYVEYSDEFIIYVNNKIEFSIPVIGVVRRLNQWATRPLVFLLYQLFAHESSEPTQQDEEEAEAQEEEEVA